MHSLQYPAIAVQHMLMSTGKVYQVDIIGGVEMVKVPVSVSWLVKEDFGTADELHCKFIDEGSIEAAKDNKWGRESFMITVQLSDGAERTVRLNNTSRALLCNAYGKESKDWIGKEATIRGSEEMVGRDVRWVMYVRPK